MGRAFTFRKLTIGQQFRFEGTLFTKTANSMGRSERGHKTFFLARTVVEPIPPAYPKNGRTPRRRLLPI